MSKFWKIELFVFFILAVQFPCSQPLSKLVCTKKLHNLYLFGLYTQATIQEEDSQTINFDYSSIRSCQSYMQI